MQGPYGGWVDCFAIKGSPLFVGMHLCGVFLSKDDGKSWHAVNTGLSDLFLTSLTVSVRSFLLIAPPHV
jgi:hypothetical protein